MSDVRAEIAADSHLSRVLVDGEPLDNVESITVLAAAGDRNTRMVITFVRPEALVAVARQEQVTVKCGVCGDLHSCGAPRRGATE